MTTIATCTDCLRNEDGLPCDECASARFRRVFAEGLAVQESVNRWHEDEHEDEHEHERDALAEWDSEYEDEHEPFAFTNTNYGGR